MVAKLKISSNSFRNVLCVTIISRSQLDVAMIWV